MDSNRLKWQQSPGSPITKSGEWVFTNVNIAIMQRKWQDNAWMLCDGKRAINIYPGKVKSVYWKCDEVEIE